MEGQHIFSVMYFASGPSLLTGVPHLKVRLPGLKLMSVLAHSDLWKSWLPLIVDKNDPVLVIPFLWALWLGPALGDSEELQWTQEGGSCCCGLEGPETGAQWCSTGGLSQWGVPLLVLAQLTILGPRNRAPHWALCSAQRWLQSLSFSLCPSLSPLSEINKSFKILFVV